MKICENGTVREMDVDEVAALQDARNRAETEEKRRPLSQAEVQEMLVRQQINTLVVDDQTALRMASYYPTWTDGAAYAAGDRLVYNGDLYRVLTAHTAQKAWLPGAGTEGIYVRVEEQHDGSKYDPIPYSGNMALESGKYYSQGGVTYLCNRDTGNPVYHALPELVGLYVMVVTED